MACETTITDQGLKIWLLESLISQQMRACTHCPSLTSQTQPLPQKGKGLVNCVHKPYPTRVQGVVSQARPFIPQCQLLSVCGTWREGSGDLRQLCVNVWNAIIELVMCKDAFIDRSRLLDTVLFTRLLVLFVQAMIKLGFGWHLRQAYM